MGQVWVLDLVLGGGVRAMGNSGTTPSVTSCMTPGPGANKLSDFTSIRMRISTRTRIWTGTST